MNRKEFYKLYSNWKNSKLNENQTLIMQNFNINDSVFHNDLGDLIIDLFYIRDQSHLFHWQTTSHSLHVALGEFYENYIDLLDDLIEMTLGAFNNRPSISQSKSIELLNYSEYELQLFIQNSLDIMTIKAKDLIDPTYTEIYNKIDEIVEQINILSYKMSLK